MTVPISAAITEALKAARAQSALTRDEVAAAAQSEGAPASFTPAALRNLESGRRSPGVEELVWLAAALRTTPRALLGEHAGLFGADAPAEAAEPACGAVEQATRDAVDGLDDDDDPARQGHRQALAQAAFALARQLDDGAGMAAAAIARELRTNLAEIFEGVAGGGDDGDGDLGPS